MRYAVPFLTALLISSASLLTAQGAPRLHWEPAPSALPAGAQMAIISGDPARAGPYVIQLSMPAGYRIPPHTHPNDETVTVLKGHFLIGRGSTFNQNATRRMTPGTKETIKAGIPHFAAVEGAAVVSIAAVGPFTITYVNPADDPTRTVAAK